MTLLAIIIVFFLMQHWGGARAIQQDDWLLSWNQWATAQLARLKLPAEIVTVAVVVVPALGFSTAICWLDGLFWGGLSLILLLGVLLYSLGRGDFNGLVDQYLAAWRSRDFHGAYHIAQRFSHGQILEQTENLADLQRHTVQAMLYQSFERWFAVIFWFIALGPFGALVYRISFVLANEGGLPDKSCNTLICRVIYWLEWLPLRLFGLSVAVVGDFGACVKVWREELWPDDVSTEERLMHYGLAALGENTPLACQEADDSEDLDALVIQGASQLERLRTIVNRAVIFSLVVVAAMVIVL